MHVRATAVQKGANAKLRVAVAQNQHAGVMSVCAETDRRSVLFRSLFPPSLLFLLNISHPGSDYLVSSSLNADHIYAR